MDTAAAKAQATRIEFATKNLARLGGYGSWAGHYSRDLPAALEAQGGWNKAAAELARHDCNVGEFGCSAPDSKGLCTKHQLAEAKGKLKAKSEGLVRTGKWERLDDGYLMCMVCCTGMRCECGPGEHISREGCPNCLGENGGVFFGRILRGSKEDE